MTARMISLLRLKGRRVKDCGWCDAACLIVIHSLLCDGLGYAVERLPCLTGRCLAPDSLNYRAPMPACPHHRGETSATIWGVGSRHVNPSPPEHRATGHIWSCPLSRTITRQRTRYQSHRRDEVALAHTYQSEPNTPPTAGLSRWGATKP